MNHESYGTMTVETGKEQFRTDMRAGVAIFALLCTTMACVCAVIFAWKTGKPVGLPLGAFVALSVCAGWYLKPKKKLPSFAVVQLEVEADANELAHAKK